MECFTWEQGLLTEGITLQDREGCPAIELGQEQRLWRDIFVDLFKPNPPDIFHDQDGKPYIRQAYPVRRKEPRKAPGVRFVLAKPHETHDGDVRKLIAVSTRAENVHPKDSGFWRTLTGDVETIASGTLPAENGEGFWRVGLIRLDVESSMHIAVSDPLKEDYVLSLEGGELVPYTWSEYFGA